MSIYFRAYSAASDTHIVASNATYATARASTASTSANTAATTGTVQNSFVTPTYFVGQSFLIFDTSSLAAGTGTGNFSVSVTQPNTDTIRFREASSTTSKIAGASLSALTLHSDPGGVAATGRFSAAVSSVSALPRSATFNVVIHTVGEENGTTPSTGGTPLTIRLSDTSGTVDDPYLDVVFGTAWSFVGVSAIGTPVTATPIILTEPAGVADGDLLIACIASRTTATTAITGTGWTAVGSQNNNNTLTTGSAIASGTMLYRIRSGTPTLSFTLPATVSVAMGQIVAYRGSAATTPLDASTAATAAAGLTPSVTGLTTTQDDDLIVAMAAGGQEAAWSAFNNVGASGWSPTDKSSDISLSSGNKTATHTAAVSSGVRSVEAKTSGTAGKYYAEFLLGATLFSNYGITPTSNTLIATTLNFSINTSGSIRINGASSGSSVGTAVAGDVICVAWDAGAKLVWFRRNNGAWSYSGDPATGAGGSDVSFAASTPHALWSSIGNIASGEIVTIRTEAAEFTQAVPSGFSAWAIGLGPLTASGTTDTTTAPSITAWIERADNVTTSGADTSLGIFDAVRTGTGETGNLTVTASVSAGHVVIAGAFKIFPAVTAKTLPAAAGSYALTGQATSTELGRLVTAASSAYALTGTDATLTKAAAVIAYNLPAAAGSYALTGATAGLYLGREVLGVAGSYGLSGQVTSLEYGREAAADPGAYTLSGQATSLELGKEVLAIGGAYALTGATAATLYARRPVAVPGAYALTGVATSLELGKEIAAVSGSYVLSGASASLLHAYKPVAVSGTYALTGTPANLLKPGSYAIIGLPGAYALTGTATSLEYGREVLATGGSYTLAGTDTSLEKGREVAADAGSYAISGVATSLERGYTVAAAPSSYVLTGNVTSLEYGREVLATGGSYALTGTTTSLKLGREVLAIAGSYALSGLPVNLLKSGAWAIIGLPGSYALTGQPATPRQARAVTAPPGTYTLTGTPVGLAIGGGEVIPPGGGQRDGDAGERRKKRRGRIYTIIIEAAKKVVERQKMPLRKKRKKLAKLIAEEVLPEAGGLLAADKLLLELMIRRQLEQIPLTSLHTQGWYELQDQLMQVITDAEQTAQRLRFESEEEDDLLLLLTS